MGLCVACVACLVGEHGSEVPATIVTKEKAKTYGLIAAVSASLGGAGGAWAVLDWVHTVNKLVEAWPAIRKQLDATTATADANFLDINE